MTKPLSHCPNEKEFNSYRSKNLIVIELKVIVLFFPLFFRRYFCAAPVNFYAATSCGKQPRGVRDISVYQTIVRRVCEIVNKIGETELLHYYILYTITTVCFPKFGRTLLRFRRVIEFVSQRIYARSHCSWTRQLSGTISDISQPKAQSENPIRKNSRRRSHR